jgi:hypothetical protein
MSDKINNEQRRNDSQQPPPAASQDTPAPTADHDRRTNSQIADLQKRVSSYERGMLWWTRVVAAFTVVSSILACVYAYSFIQSERAFLTVPDVAFANSEPSSAPNGVAIIITIKNVGKHIATGINLTLNSAFFGIKRDLPPNPVDENSLVKPIIIPPIAPDGTWRGTMLEIGDIKNISGGPMKSRNELIKDLVEGNIPFRVWGGIEYDLGFPSWTTGKTGFCYEFVPMKLRLIGQTFHVCENLPKYTYAK